MPSPEVLSLLEYRLRAVAIGHLALQYSAAWDEIPSIEIFFDGNQIIEGKATAFTNGAIESAIIHCRALIEFLGLGLKKRAKRNSSGFRVGVKATMKGSRTYPAWQNFLFNKLYKRTPVRKTRQRKRLANKGLAHTTSSFTKQDRGSELLEMAFRGVPTLVVNNVYVPLKIEPPNYKLQARKRSA